MGETSQHKISGVVRKFVNVFHSQPLIAHQVVILLLGILIYSNTLHVPFVFDDNTIVVNNPRLHDLDQFIRSFNLRESRIFGYLTFALNHAIHGVNVTGYHVTNLTIHLATSLLVYWFVLLTLQTPALRTHGDATLHTESSRRVIALIAALLFVSHPIQTQAVTYIVQRLASLATMCYLLSLLLYARWRLFHYEGGASYSLFTAKNVALYGGSLAGALLSFRTKEISYTLPVVLILFESMFFKGNARKRFLPLLPFLLLGGVFIILEITSRGAFGDVAATDAIAGQLQGIRQLSRGEYLITQFRVIITYLRLLLLPVNQNLDYDYPVSSTFFDMPVILSFLFLLAVFAGAVFLLYRSRPASAGTRSEYRLISFGLFWFFVTLSVESSIIPIDDIIMEHRLYLPSVGFFAAVAAAASLIFETANAFNATVRKAVAVLFVLVVGCLSIATYARNTTWGDLISIHEDIVSKSANKPRPHINLGVIYEERGLLDKAAREYSTALLLNPNDALAHYNLGSLYFKHGYLDKALAHFQAIVAINPNMPSTHEKIGIIYYRTGRYHEARNAFQTALRLRPDLVQARYHLELLSDSTTSPRR